MDTYSIFGDPDPASFLNADLDSAAFCKNTYIGEIDGFIEQNSCFCLLAKLHAIVAD